MISFFNVHVYHVFLTRKYYFYLSFKRPCWSFTVMCNADIVQFSFKHIFFILESNYACPDQKER